VPSAVRTDSHWAGSRAALLVGATAARWAESSADLLVVWWDYPRAATSASCWAVCSAVRWAMRRAVWRAARSAQKKAASSAGYLAEPTAALTGDMRAAHSVATSGTR
jgi:hypothetical protein